MAMAGDNSALSLFPEIDPGVEGEETAADVAITVPFDPNDVRIDAVSPTIDLLLTRIKHGEINLEPDFQRQGGIWNDVTQSRLIESLLVKIPLPAFYFDATNDDEWLVVDGLQRLMTLKRFAVDKGLRLRNMEFLKGLNEMTFDELPRQLQRRIVETQVTAYRIQPGTPPKVKFTIFRRINTGGLPLSAQEIRHALNQGVATKLLQELADNFEFKLATDFGLRNERMADRECVLRFLTFYRTPYTEYESEDFDAFLSDAMAGLNVAPTEDISQSSVAFLRAMRLANVVFGRDAFRKLARKPAQRSPINKALFESWAVNLAMLHNFDAKAPAVEAIRLANEKLLLQDPYFVEAISVGTGSPRKVHYRFKAVADALHNAVV